MTTRTEPLDPFARNVATIVRTLMQLRGVTTRDVLERLHVSRATWYSHLASGAWSARQIAALAELLEVPVDVLYGEPDDLLRIGSFATLEGGGDVSAPRRGHLRPV